MNAGALTSGQLTAAQCADIATWWANLLGAFNAHLSTQRMVVLSQVAGSGNPIVSTRVDSRLDIQRRRADRESILQTATATVG